MKVIHSGRNGVIEYSKEEGELIVQGASMFRVRGNDERLEMMKV